jgi:DNA segregation ATPase FtsK/SpoIIIE-like protein
MAQYYCKKCGFPIDSVYVSAVELAIDTQSVSLSMMQRRLGIGFNKAVQVLDWLEKMKFVGEFEGSTKPRKVLITKEKFEEYLAEFETIEEETKEVKIIEKESQPKSKKTDKDYIKALKFVIEESVATISFVQRKLGCDFNKAGKIIDWMELSGFVGPFEGGQKPRKVLITKNKFDELYGDGDI